MAVVRVLYFSLGWLFFIVGFIGAFVPVLPTTIFMILALWMFSKSSTRFHDWLFHHRIFGPSLQRWVAYRVIPMCAKILAVLMMLGSFIYVIIFIVLPVWVYVAIGLGMSAVALYILSKPSRVPYGSEEIRANRANS